MSSVRIKYTDPAVVQAAVRAHANALRRRDPSILRIHWFGSWTTGTFTPGSDVDLCIVVRENRKPRRERSVDYLPSSFPVGLDLHVYTEQEFEELAAEHSDWMRELTSGIEV